MGIIGTIGGFFAGYVVGSRKANWTKALRGSPTSATPLVDTRRVSEIMTASPETIGTDATLSQAAGLMAKNDIGDVIVVNPNSDDVIGIITDRDIVIRACAEGANPTSTSIEGYFTPSPTVVGPNDLVQEVDFLMRDQDVRRVPVVESGRAIGIVSLGDLVAQTEPRSALAAMTIAPPDH